MRSRAGIPILLLLSAAAVAQDPVTENHPNGKPFRVYEVDAQGRKHGKFEQFAVDGRLEQRMHFVAGKLSGKYETFYANGKLHVVGSYNKERRHGLWREFSAEGDKVEFVTWRFGVRNGQYQSFHPGGKKKLIGGYRNGKLHGRCQQFSADQSWHRDLKYKDGVVHGKVTIKRSGKTVSKQKWVDGAIVELDGIVPFPKTRKQLRLELAQILQPKKPVELDAADPLAAQRAGALRRLQAYRHLCGLRWEDMALVAKWNDLCDAASEVCRANGGLSHHPKQPPGFDTARYQKGYLGASKSNLSGGSGMVRSVDSYMDDSDPSNIDRIGHRRWCLNPGMKLTGFGGAGGYAAMWSMDSSGSTPRGMRAVMYPPPGYVPVGFFGGRHAWSISVMRGGMPGADDIEVDVRPLDEYFEPVGEPMQLDAKHIAAGGFGSGKCLVFRPVGLRVQPGARYLVRIRYAKNKRGYAFRYVVGFCESVGK